MKTPDRNCAIDEVVPLNIRLDHPYDVSEAAGLLNVSEFIIRNLCESSYLFARNVGTAHRKIWRIPGREIQRFWLHGPRQPIQSHESQNPE